MRPVVGLGSFEGGEEGVMYIDGVRRVLRAELMAENLQQPRQSDSRSARPHPE